MGKGQCDTENQAARSFPEKKQRLPHAPAQSGEMDAACPPPWAPPVLTGVPAITLVADFPQAVEALTDAPQPVLQLHVPGAQHLHLHAAHVLRADGVLLNLCGDTQSADEEGPVPRGCGDTRTRAGPCKVQTQEPAAAPSVLTLRVGKHRLGAGGGP